MRTVLAQLEDRHNETAAALTAILAVAIVVGSAVLWIGIPILGLWLAGRFTTTAEGFVFATLGGIPLAMVGFGWVLYRTNALYLRSLGPDEAPEHRHSAWLVSYSDERGRSRRQRAPRRLIDVAMTISLSIALVVMVIWFCFLSEMWLVNPL